MVIGLIGCGRMGMCMLKKLLENGYEVIVYDKFSAAAEKAQREGAKTVKSPKAVAETAETIILSLPGPAQIEEALFGKNGVSEAVTKEHIIIDTSTVQPETTGYNADKVATSGGRYLDCPILGRPSAAGKWTLPVGGSKEALEEVYAVLHAFADKIVWVGESGAGNALKLLNQMMFSAINGITAEVMAMAKYVGISQEVFYDTVANSSAATVSGLFKETGKTIISEDFENPSFTVDLLIKDTELAIDMAKKADAPSVLAQTVQTYNQLAHAQGLGAQDTSALYKVFSGHYKKEK